MCGPYWTRGAVSNLWVRSGVKLLILDQDLASSRWLWVRSRYKRLFPDQIQVGKPDNSQFQFYHSLSRSFCTFLCKSCISARIAIQHVHFRCGIQVIHALAALRRHSPCFRYGIPVLPSFQAFRWHSQFAFALMIPDVLSFPSASLAFESRVSDADSRWCLLTKRFAGSEQIQNI